MKEEKMDGWKREAGGWMEDEGWKNEWMEDRWIDEVGKWKGGWMGGWMD